MKLYIYVGLTCGSIYMLIKWKSISIWNDSRATHDICIFKPSSLLKVEFMHLNLRCEQLHISLHLAQTDKTVRLFIILKVPHVQSQTSVMIIAEVIKGYQIE